MATVDVAEKNRDWEAVSADDKFFYIGDFGNNGGKRKDLVIHKVARSDFKHSATLAIDYADNDIAKNSYYNHDFDAESLVAKDDHLVMFSKSWLTKVVNVYQVDPQAASQSLSAVAQISGIPGVITGLDWDKYNQRFVIVGYNSNAFGVFDPFIALVSNAYELQELFVLEGYGQVEGVCVTSKDELWFTQEKSPFNIAKLVKVQLLNEE